MPVYSVKNSKTGKSYEMPWDNEKPPTSFDVAKFVDEQDGLRDSFLTKADKFRQKSGFDYLPDAVNPSKWAEGIRKNWTDPGMDEGDTLKGKAKMYSGAFGENFLNTIHGMARPDSAAIIAATGGSGLAAAAGRPITAAVLGAPGIIGAGTYGVQGLRDIYDAPDISGKVAGAAQAVLGGYGAMGGYNLATMKPRGPKPLPTVTEEQMPQSRGLGPSSIRPQPRPPRGLSEAPIIDAESYTNDPSRLLPPQGGSSPSNMPPPPAPPPASIAPRALPPARRTFYGGAQGGVSTNINEPPNRVFSGGSGRELPQQRTGGRFGIRSTEPMQDVTPSGAGSRDILEQTNPYPGVQYPWNRPNPSSEVPAVVPPATPPVHDTGSIVEGPRRPDAPPPPAPPPIRSVVPPPANITPTPPFRPPTRQAPPANPLANVQDADIYAFARQGDKDAVAEMGRRGLQFSNDMSEWTRPSNLNDSAQAAYDRIRRRQSNGDEYLGGRPDTPMQEPFRTDLQPVDPSVGSMERYNPTTAGHRMTPEYEPNSYQAPTDLSQAGQRGLPDLEMLHKPYPPKWPGHPMKFGQFLEARPQEPSAPQGQQLPVIPLKPGGGIKEEIGPSAPITKESRSGWRGEPMPSERMGDLNYKDIRPPTAEMERVSPDLNKELRSTQLTRGSAAPTDEVWNELKSRFIDRPGQEPMMPRGQGRAPKTAISKVPKTFSPEPLTPRQQIEDVQWRVANKDRLKLIEAEHERLYPTRMTADDKIARMEKLGALFQEAVTGGPDEVSVKYSPESFDRYMIKKYGRAYDRMKRLVTKDYERPTEEAATRFDPFDKLDEETQGYMNEDAGLEIDPKATIKTAARGDVLLDPLAEDLSGPPSAFTPKSRAYSEPRRVAKPKDIPVLGDLTDTDLNIKAAQGDKQAELALANRPWMREITERENKNLKPERPSNIMAKQGPSASEISDIEEPPSMDEWKGMMPGRSEMDIWKEGTGGKKAGLEDIKGPPRTPETVAAEMEAKKADIPNIEEADIPDEGMSFREKLGQAEMKLRSMLGGGGDSEEGAVKMWGGGLRKKIKKGFTSKEAPESPAEKSLKVENKEKAKDWTTRRAAAKTHGEMVAEDFADLEAGGVGMLDKFLQGDKTGRLADAQTELDALYKAEFQSGATELNKTAWMKAIKRPRFLDKDGKPLPQAAYRAGRTPNTYKEGLAIGLDPLHENVADFLADVTKRSKVRIANKEFDEYLEDTDQKKPTSISKEGEPTYTSVSNPEVVRSLAGEDAGLLSRKGRLTQYIENVHGNKDPHMKIAGEATAKSKNLYLAGGIPGTPLNMHGWSIGRSLFKAMGREGVGNFVKGIKRGGTKWLDSEAKRLRPLVREALDQGYQHSAGEAEAHDAMSKWLAKYPVGDWVNGLMKLEEKWFEDPLFKRSLPVWKAQLLEQQTNRLTEDHPSWPREKVLKNASQQAADFLGGQNKTLRSQNMQNLSQSVFLAPDWMESQLKQGYKGVKATFGKEDPIYRDAMARNAALRMIGLGIQTADDDDSDKPTDITTVGLGKTASGRYREYPLYNASDPMNLIEIALAGAAKNDYRPASKFLKNRLNQPFQSLINMSQGTDSYGNPMTGEDQFRRPISGTQSLLNYMDEFTKPLQPQQMQALVGFGRGKIGAEEALMQSIEAPVKYSAPKKEGGGTRGRRGRSRR